MHLQAEQLRAVNSLRLHPEYELVPPMREDEFSAFLADVQERGVVVPIEIIGDQIIDGRSRWLAAQKANLESIQVREAQIGSLDPVVYMLRQASMRRHLTDDQRAAIAEEERKYLAAKNKAKPGPGRGHKKEEAAWASSFPEYERSRTKVAKAHKVSEKRVREVGKLDPASFAKVKAGEKTLIEVRREIRASKREAKREQNRQKVSEVKEPSKLIESGVRFSTIAIDPPWDWGDEGDDDQLGRARPDYATKSLEELEQLPVSILSDDDCHIYLWITNRSLPKGFRLLDAWGFRYITCLTWCKPSIGMGNYFRGSTEQILFGVKGSQPLKRKDVGTWFQWDRGKRGHSSKPKEFFELVESCSPGPYLEMFGRDERNEWTIWGENS